MPDGGYPMPSPAQKNSAPIWAFTGPEIGERNAAVDELRAACAREAGKLDAHSMYAADVRVGDVVSLLQNGSLFADARFIVMRNANEIKKKEDLSSFSRGSRNLRRSPTLFSSLFPTRLASTRKSRP